MTKGKNCPVCESGAIDYEADRGWDQLWHCRQCDLVFAWPQLQETELEAYYDEVTHPEYLLKYEEESFRRGRRILSFLEKRWPRGAILDVGCGCGFFLKVAQDGGWQPEGVEISPRAAELSRRYGNFRIHVGKFDERQGNLATYPVISAQHILEHMRDPVQFLKALHEKLQPKGILVVAVPNRNSWMRRWADIDWVCLRERGHLFHFTIESLKNLLEKGGFRLLAWETPQWNSLDLLWAWRRRNRPKVVPAAQPEAAAAAEPEAPKKSYLRNVVSQLSGPIAWLAEEFKFGAEILIYAEKR